VRFTGQKLPGTVVVGTPTSVVDLDDNLLALTVASKYASAKAKPNAGVLGQQMQTLLIQLLGNDPQALTTFRIGLDDEDRRRVRHVPLRVITSHG
jgi:hypothetical protein